ncbi:MAG: 50S ribosomal protein L9 [Ruthenibacterium sp.]
MKVVLKQDIKDIGKKDQLVEVSDGYGRNFLLPRKLAIEASAAAVNDVKNKESAKQHHAQVELEEANAAASRIDGTTIVLHAKAGQGGRLFGAITAKDIAEAVEKACGQPMDKRKIVLDKDIKNYGRYEVDVKVHAGVTAKIIVAIDE